MARKYCKTPTIFQMEATECGAASMAMICAYWGKNIPLEKMRIETGVSRDGCNAGNIMRAGKRFGMDVHGYRKEPNELKNIKLPCIIHWNFNHFVVFEGFKRGYAYINDPAMGRRKITLEELDQSFTGIVITFEPLKSFKKERKKNHLIPLIKERLYGQGKAVAQMFILGIFLILPGLILPVLSQVFLDEILGQTNISWFGNFMLFLCCTILFELVIRFYRSVLLVKMQNKMTVLSIRKFLERLFRLPISYFSQRYPGDLTNRVSNNNNVNIFLTGELAETVLNIFIASFYLILLVIYSPTMTVIGLIGILVNIVLVKVSSENISNMIMKLQQDKGKLTGALCAGLSITSTLKACGVENLFCSRILGFEAKADSQEQRVSKVQSIVGAMPIAISNIISVVLLIVGAKLVIEGSMTLGMLSAFTALYGSFSEPIDSLVGSVKKIQVVKADMERVADILNYPKDDSFSNGHNQDVNNKKISGKVECKNVAFGYSMLSEALISDFSFQVSAGSSIAFVGASGSGKSTVSKIISGLYRPWGGMVLFDNKEMSKIAPEIFHASVSTVSQNISLFSGTIKDNITLWNSAILEKDIINAAKDACIHEMITQKPGAYDYVLSEGGTNLSGGQRQRLEIARALVTNPSILIMDEATSALDPIVEKEIIDNIKKRGCTCIIVAHRLSAVRNCDEIVVMSNGKIVERGSHEELINNNGFYRDIMTTN